MGKLINRIIKKLEQLLTKNVLNLKSDENDILDRINSVKVFSNIPELSQLTKLTEICQKLNEIKSDLSKHSLLEYSLQPITSLRNLKSEQYAYFPLSEDIISRIEEHLKELSRMEGRLIKPFNTEEEKRLCEKHLQNVYRKIEESISNEREEYRSTISRIGRIVEQMRSSEIKEGALVQMKIDEFEESLADKISTINNKLRELNEKLQSINTLENDGIIYCNVKEDDKDLQRIEEQLVKNNSEMIILCFDDKLEKPHTPLWNQFYQMSIEKYRKTSQMKLLYADFSYCCSCFLTEFYALPRKDTFENGKSKSKEKISKVATTSSKPPKSSPEPTVSKIKASSAATQSITSSLRIISHGDQREELINVLLLGESGVGKSTFINAIVNYLRFEDFPAARSGEPIVLTPVSFLMTQGDNFEERIVTFGKQDPNENHNNTGQSVTQHCRSYVFTIDDQTKMRLIDTPGMGDTRGLDQDDRNMEHILSFINNLPHLNAICILLKPNESRLNVVFRSYFSRLVGFLGEHVRDNIVFCFTNTRLTFSASGNIGSLLKKMLQSHSIKDIPFGKTNTFCFDSRSFRYLIARMNGIAFDDYQKEEYERSWITSASESHRLLQYICSGLKSYPQKKWQSIEHAHFQIVRLTRPLLETMRNNLRNIMKMDKSSSKSLIQISANPVPHNASVCLASRKPKWISEFWLIPDKIHLLSDRCDECQCVITQHRKVNYQIQYEISNDEEKPSLDELKADLDRLKTILAEFAGFHKYTMNISKEKDPMFVVLNEIIDEEKNICSRKGSDVLNSILGDKLENTKRAYENLWTTSPSNRSSMTLSDVYQQIKIAGKNRTIKEQLYAIRQTEEMHMIEQEKYVT